MRQIQGVQFFDDGKIGIDWLETTEQQPVGGQFHTTYVTLEGQEAEGQVQYFCLELRTDVDELLHHILKMLKT